MNMGINGISAMADQISSSAYSSKASALQDRLGGDLSSATDEELMDVCKEFEAYFVEQVLKEVEKTIPKDEEEEENEYMKQFGDMLYEQVATSIADRGELGLAQQLYEAMKREQGVL